MKHIVHTLNVCSQKGDATVVAKGIGGVIALHFFSSEIIKVEYQFEGIEIDASLTKASEYITEPAKDQQKKVNLSLSEEEAYFFIKTEQTSVKLEKSHGLVSIYYKGILQHGGRVGNADTVVPSYQIRCFTKQTSNDSVSRFNFPLQEEDAFYGLGDKSGLPNRRGRRFSMFNRDSLGYDASNSDPLYKSIPFLLKVNTGNKVLCGMLFDQVLIKTIDLGRESPYYFSIEVEGGPYGYVVFLGDDYHQVMKNYYTVTGFPALPPLFSFGFFGSSMNYVEPDDAPQRILDYFSTIEKYHIPCEGMYVSSGYLKSAEGKRYAFLWNKQKFPDYRRFLSELSHRGYNLCMNIKPGILSSHPWYERLKEKGYFIQDRNGNPYQEFFWGGEASFIDFNNPEAKDWWKEQLKKQYLDHGCTGIWNDNNELELEDIDLESYKCKALYPIKMAEASYEAFKAEHPDQRPWVYSRSGYAGIQRFARTWSGDNVSDWKTLKYNQYMGVGFGLSGLPYFGHDLGGFFGSFPDEELLVRSCQSAVFQGRFVIHSWREDGNPTEPWSYPGALGQIRSLIEEHYRFMPYIYTCAYEAATEGKPLERSLHLEYPQDTQIQEDEVNVLFGPSLLKVMVTDKGKESAEVYLPQGEIWYDKLGNAYQGGNTHTVSYPCNGEIQWFVKEGAVLPTAPSLKHLSTGLFPYVEFLVFPSHRQKLSRYFEDDGKTELQREEYNIWEFNLEDTTLQVTKKKGNAKVRNQKRTFSLIAPKGYHLDVESFDPEQIQEGESITIHILG